MVKNYRFLDHNLFFLFLSRSLEFSIEPIIVGYEKCLPNKETIGPRTKSHYLLHYVIDGAGTYSIGEKNYTIEANTLFLIPPDLETSYRPDPSNPWTYIWIEFQGINAKALCDKALLCRDDLVYKPENFEPISEDFADMIDQCTIESEDNVIFCTAQLLRILRRVIRERNRFPSKSVTKEEQRLRSVLDYIEHNYLNASLTIEDVAKATFFNVSYLSRLFKQVVGISPTKYIIELRMQRACHMLHTKSYSITDIASSVGYNSPFYFSREFKRLFHCTPSKYIEQVLD